MASSTVSPSWVTAAVRKVRLKFQAASTASLSDRQAASIQAVQATASSTIISKAVFPAPGEDDIRGVLFHVIRRLGSGHEVIEWPETVDVEAEWAGFERTNAQQSPILLSSEEEKYERIMRSVSHQVTILYVHGGAFYLNSPARCRSTVSRLCELTGGRCLSVKYRLAPQNPFPAAILDVLVAYFSLLYPSSCSYHEAIPASSIVLAGDSAGTALCLALVQTILRSQEHQPAIRFHGQAVPLVLPAGLALLSVVGDLTGSLPSWIENGDYDILRKVPPTAQPSFPADDIWPSSPPRSDPYCDNSSLCHPLVAPATATNWKGAPPMWIACGQERLADSGKIIAQTAAQQGVNVLWEQYEAMPHTWAQIFSAWPQSVRCLNSWAHACRMFVDARERVFSRGTIVAAQPMMEEAVSVTKLTPLTPSTALALMEEKCRYYKPFIGTKVKPQL